MSIIDCPRLCGGTFFTLLLEARGQRTAKRDNADGKTDGLSQPELLIELVKIIKPVFNPPVKISTLKKNVGGYRQCEDNGGTYFASVFESDNDTKSFNERFENSHDSVLGEMTALAMRFLDKDKCEWLVKSLIETIKKDSTIDEAQAFYIDGQEINKSKFSSINKVSLPSFLLGIWHYIVMNVTDNTVGITTFSKWHKKKGETNSAWVFNYGANVGSSITDKIAVAFPKAAESPHITNPPTNEISRESEDSRQAYYGYLEFMKNKYKTVKTLLFDNAPVPFYDFYVCNDILSRFG